MDKSNYSKNNNLQINLNQEITNLKHKLNLLINTESNNLLNQDVLSMSTDLDLLIVEYMKENNI